VTRVERWLLWIATLLVGASGCAYGWMKYLLRADDPYAVVNHSLQPLALKLHVLTAPLLVFAIGLVYAKHIWSHWVSGQRGGRGSGAVAWLTLLPMIASGYWIQAVADRGWIRWIVGTHLVFGGAYLVGFLWHQARVGAIRGRTGNGSARDSRTAAVGR